MKGSIVNKLVVSSIQYSCDIYDNLDTVAGDSSRNFGNVPGSLFVKMCPPTESVMKQLDSRDLSRVCTPVLTPVRHSGVEVTDYTPGAL